MSSLPKVLSSILPIDNLFIVSELIDAYIPISIILLIVFLIFNYKKAIKIIDKNIINGYLSIFLIATILVITPWIWKILPSIFINIQFAWRNCAYIGFSVCVLATLSLLLIPKKYFKAVIISTLLISFIIFTYITYSPEHIIRNNNWTSAEAGMGVEKEYLPKNLYENMYYYEMRNQDIYIIKGNAKIKILENDTPYLKFKIDTDKETIVEIPRIYYLWYDINLLDKNKEKIHLEFYENKYGFIEFKIPKSGIVTVEYKKTLISTLASIISFITIPIFGIYLFILKKHKKVST
jgi:hypothetical protein